mmetsp:Transcript_16328/g.52374  ORF Transcript_16328/g.52374 Transcript_16328/m.52374 type:complete len:312 (+) Transcript_16328:171-1106(+)
MVGASATLVHYHKTGHDLTRSIRGVLIGSLRLYASNSSVLDCARCRVLHRACPWRCGQLQWLDPLPERHLVIVTAPDVACIQKEIPSSHRIVHFVRDPARWAISAYDYHKQVPTPEPWVQDWDHGTICRLPELPYQAILDAELTRVALQMCTRLYDLNQTLYGNLRQLPEDGGVRLMALFGVLAAGTGWHWQGDTLRMAMNARALQPLAVQGRVHTVWLDNVVQRPEFVFQRLARFLLPSAPSQIAAEAGRTLVRHQKAEFAKQSTGKHVTSTRLNDSRKDHLLSVLNTEPTLKRIFASALSAVHKNELAA